MPLFRRLWKREDDDESSGDEVTDNSAGDLSYVGTAAYDVLRRHHNHHHHELWNVTKGKVVGELQFTPKDAFTRTEAIDPPIDHDDWFPTQIGEIISRTEEWCDILTLAPPDGRFMEEFKSALATIVKNREGALGRVVIRMMFGNIVGMPVNCNRLIKELTQDLPMEAPARIKLWVGSWRKDVSWNHAKIIAVDGKYLWTGGHNFWDKHYLRVNPVNDLSLEMEGGPAKDAHRFANAQWGYIVKKQSTAWGRFVDRRLHDSLEVPRRARVTVSDYPEESAAEFPPYWKEQNKKARLRRGPMSAREFDPAYVPVITMGRFGALLKKARPSDDAFVAMIDSAQHIIRFALQDLGPVALPGTKRALPGLAWPKKYLEAMARALWLRGVDLEIVLSNPGSIPGNCSPTEACYGNGWSCVDVAAEIIKRIQTQFPDVHHGDLRKTVKENLRVSFLRSPRGGTHYKDNQTLGLHSKHFIVDDICCYIGSQNLYICDLAEWGVLIDDPEETLKIKAEYWDPMWKTCYLQDDCDVQAVMDGLQIDRTPPSKAEMTKEEIMRLKIKARAAARAAAMIPAENLKKYGRKQDDDDDNGSDSDDKSEVSEGED